jgi:hypothetical protein
MNEKPLERLNYYNGQRLQAVDFKLEQDYHMRVRRWLNRSLYPPGIASGLEVYAIEGKPLVRVLPGLAIDVLGREIILLEEQVVDVVGQHSANGGCTGPYLTIRYQEELTLQESMNCAPCGNSANKAAWGGPARILADPVLELNVDLPNPASGKVALACITLAEGCGSIESVDTGVRHYIGDGTNPAVRQYALEGVRDIDANNFARIYFHIRGRQPASVTLYLRSEILPTLYYTEMGNHTHGNGGTLNIPAHTHGGGNTGGAGGHTPNVNSVKANVDGDVWAGVLGVAAAAAAIGAAPGNVAAPGFVAMGVALGGTAIAEYADSNVNPDANFMDLTLSPHFFHHATGPNNQRELKGAQAVNMNVALDPVADHTHAIGLFPADGSPAVLALSGTGAGVAAGVDDVNHPDYVARSGPPLKYVNDLQLAIDGRGVTVAARTQVANNRPPNEDWSKFGRGTSNHPFVTHGTGAIRVDFLPGVILSQGEHYIDLSLTGVGNGGRVHFNLYVE